jgi:hypothetical protein
MDLTIHLVVLKNLAKKILKEFPEKIDFDLEETLEELVDLINEHHAEDVNDLVKKLIENLSFDLVPVEDKEVEKNMNNTAFDGKARVLNHTFTNSSLLSKAKYDRVAEMLTLWFKTATNVSYEHYSVPEEVYQELVEASSAGHFYTS